MEVGADTVKTPHAEHDDIEVAVVAVRDRPSDGDTVLSSSDFAEFDGALFPVPVVFVI